MKKNKNVIALITFFSALAIISILLIFFSDTNRFLGGWGIKINLFILLVPVILLCLSIFVLLPLQEESKAKKTGELFFYEVERYLPYLFLLIFLFFEGILLAYFCGLTIPKDILKKCFPDILLILIILITIANVKADFPNTDVNILKKINFIPLLLIGILFSLIFINFKLTGLSSVLIEKKYFGAGAPLVTAQICFAINTGLLCFFLFKCIHPNKSFLVFFDIFIFFTLFVLAYFYWNQVEIPINYFMRRLTLTSIAPYSDSRVYDLNGLGFTFGQGIGFGAPVQKPFYSFFLGILHLLFGQNYQQIISGQILFLSFTPALFYLFMKNFLNRWVGLSGGIIIIFKEYNLAILSSTVTQSSVNMLMTDCFTTLFVLLLVLVTFFWINDPTSKKFAILSAICLSITILIRLQMAAFIPLYIIIYFISQKPRKLKLKGPLTLFIFSIMLVLLPWMIRNFIHSGQFVIEQPEYVNFSFIPRPMFSQTQNGSEENHSHSLLQQISSDVSGYLQNASSYLNNSLMSSLFQLPSDYEHNYSLEVAIKSGKYSYPFPYQELSTTQKFNWGFNILVIFFGISACQYRFNWKGLFPLAFYFTYALIISLAGYSGWRFIQPVDWIVFIYWYAGLFWLVELILGDFSIYQKKVTYIDKNIHREKSFLPTLLLALFVGLLLPFSEILIPSTIPALTKEKVLAQIVPDIATTTNNEFILKNDPLSILQKGKVLYPIYVYPGDNLVSKLSLGFAPYPSYYIKHTDFTDPRIYDQISSGNTVLFLTLANSSIQEVYLFHPKNISLIRSGQEVTVLGCDRGNFIQAYWLKIGNSVIESSDGIPLKCPHN